MKPKLTFAKELRFTPYAWSKLIWFRDRGPTEVAGYCVTETEDPLLVTDFVLIKQECTMATFDLNTDDSIEYVEKMMDKGLPPWSTNNILAHTHPSDSTTPSLTDEANFEKAFSHPNWAIMLIIGTDGSTYCRLKMNTGPGTLSLLDVVIDYGVEFGGSNTAEWEKEYKEKVFCKEFLMTGAEGKRKRLDVFEEEIDEMDCYWDTDGDVVCWVDHEETYYYYNPETRQWQMDIDEKFEVCQPPTKGGLDVKVIAWAKRNEFCRPERGEVMV